MTFGTTKARSSKQSSRRGRPSIRTWKGADHLQQRDRDMESTLQVGQERIAKANERRSFENGGPRPHEEQG